MAYHPEKFNGSPRFLQAFMESGLFRFVANKLAIVADLHPLIIIVTITLTVTFLTEMTSNTATAILLMPILAAIGVAVDVDPALLMVPAAMSA